MFVGPDDAAVLLGVSGQSMWDRIDSGEVEAAPFNGSRWVCLEFLNGEWSIREPLTEQQQAAHPPRSGLLEVVHINLNLV